MANHTRSLVIEGMPIYFGDALAWHEGEAVQCLDVMDKRPAVGREIDIMGGIMQWEAMVFDLFDKDDRIAQQIQWTGTSKVKILAPSPLYSPSDTATTPQDITVDTASHPTVGALSATAGAVHPYIIEDRAAFMAAMLACSGAWTLTAWIKIDTAGTSACLLRLKDDSLKIHVDADLINLLIDNTVVPIDNSSLGTGWHHVAVRYDGADYTSWIDSALDNTVTSAAFTPGSGGTYLFGDGSEADTEAYDIARLAFYGRALTDAEILTDFQGVPTDTTSLLYKWTGIKTTHGGTIVDEGPYKCHRMMEGYTRITRAFIPGDLLYMPLDTARVSALASGVNKYPCQRQVYSCLEDGWRAYYQTNPYPEAGAANDYVCQAAVDRPYFYVGRLAAYYLDGVLSYIGKIENIQQNGARWTLETKSLLESLTNGLKPMFGGIQSYFDWHLGYVRPSFIINGGAVTTSAFADDTRGYSYDAVPAYLAAAWSTGTVSINNTYGITTINPSADVQLNIDDYTQGTVDAFSTAPGQIYSRPTNIHATIAPGDAVNRCGICGLGQITLFLKWPGDPSALVDAWFTIAGVNLRVISSGTSTIDGATVPYVVCSSYDKDLKQISTSWGYSQDSEIIFNGAPIVAGSTIEEILHKLLVSTGAGDNGVYDAYPGWIGLGLPASLVDISAYSQYTGSLACDLSDGKIGDDLMALGFALIFEDGVFKIQKVNAPVISLATGTVLEANRLTNQTIGASWGHFCPVNAISYETAAGFVDVVAYLDNIFAASDRRVKAIKTSCGVKFTDAQRDLFVTDAFKRLQWLGNYAPTLTLTLPGHSLTLGQTVSVSVRTVAGQGRYQIVSIPALVQRIGSDYSVNLVLNTSDTASMAAWVPSWEIASYSTTTLTLKNGEGLDLDEHWTLPMTGQIIDGSGNVLEAAVDIHSATAGAVVVHTAPTYDQTIYKGILTLLDYTSADSDDQPAYVWASAAGVMSDASAGKDLA